MTALALLAAVVVSQPASVGLTLTLSVKVPADRERQTLEMLEREFAAAGLPTRRFDARCDGELVCLADFARRDGLAGLVAVTLGASPRGVVVDLDAARTDDHASVAQVTFEAEKVLSPAAREKLKKFAEATAEGLRPRAAVTAPPLPVAADAPVAPRLAPVVEAPQVAVLVVPRREPPSKIPGVVLGLGALGLAAASAGFGVVGLGVQGRATASPDGLNSALTRGEAQQLTSRANTDFTVSLATGIAAGALATAAVLWLVTGPSAEPAETGTADP
jgi:hypothetical protein